LPLDQRRYSRLGRGCGADFAAQVLVDGEQSVEVARQAVTLDRPGAATPAQVGAKLRIVDQRLQPQPELAINLPRVEHQAGASEGLAVAADVGRDARRPTCHRLEQRKG